MPEITPMRDGEVLDLERLSAYIRANRPDLMDGTLDVKQFAAGRSNLTYLITSGANQFVLRRPPLGPVAPRAHDMVREFRWMEAIHPEFSWAPEPILVCQDSSVLGSPFFLMEYRFGVGVGEGLMTANHWTAELGDRISRITVSRLAALHAVEWPRLAIRTEVKPDGFLTRQVHGWIERYQRAKTAEISGERELTRWLSDHIPASPDATILHYDYKLNNMVFTENYGDIAGIFDWEMTTVGDPLADVAVAMSYWTEAGDDPGLGRGLNDGITARPGFWSRNRWVLEYARLTGTDVSDFPYYLTFAYFKLAVILAQIYYRYDRGQTQDPRFAHMNRMVEHLVHYAWDTHPTAL